LPSNKHRAEYALRVNRVLDHIRAHLADELSLEALAQVAAFSPFHFHRIFKAMTGENLREHIQRVRLEAAASRLTRGPDDVLVIAMDHGFASASAFTRAFKDRFGMTPTTWREAGPHAAALRKPGEAESNPCTAERKPGTAGQGGDALLPFSSATSADEEDSMNVTVKNLPAFHVAYLRHIGPYGTAGIPETWKRLAKWAATRDLWTAERVCIGVALDDPMVTEPAKCRYDAAIVVPASMKVDGGPNVAEIPGGKHAVAPFEGSSQSIGAAWGELYGRWLPSSGYQPDNPCFELYRGEAWDTVNDFFRCDLCLPVRPL
jgi:AraC family transcriptional regulator